MPQVALRARTVNDHDVLFRIVADLESWEERGASPPAPRSREHFEAQFARVAEAKALDENVTFVITADGDPVGSASLFGFDTYARHAEMGISLIPEARSRGIGTSAIIQLVEFGFVRRNLHRIHLQLIASNIGALRAYEKAGFVVEGRQREHAWVRGHYEDIVIMGIVRTEWSESS